MIPLLAENATTIQLKRGQVLAITQDGKVLIENNFDGVSLECEFLRTSSAPPPPIKEGKQVLYIEDAANDAAYVLGVIERYPWEEDIPDRLKLGATQRIDLRCGCASLMMSEDGKVVIKGTEVVSRARGVNKIKGAAVKIN